MFDENMSDGLERTMRHRMGGCRAQWSAGKRNRSQKKTYIVRAGCDESFPAS